MFTHVVIFWTDPTNPNSADELMAGIEKLLRPIPGALHFSAGKMAPSPREVVDKTFQVGLNVVFASRKAHDEYQLHPRHLEFVNTFFKKNATKIRVYDFE